MKKIWLILLFSINAAVLYAQSQSSEKQISVMLKGFYTKYITAVASSDNPHISEKKLILLRNQYCTSHLLNQIPKLIEQTDSDPFLKAQDSDIAFLKTLSVKKDIKKSNVYTVSYFSSLQTKFVIYLKIVKDNEGFKIDSLW